MASTAHAAQVGVNYYHESMMGTWGGQYYPRSESGVAQDMEDIKSVTKYVKLYMNPLVAGNQDWVLRVNAIAKQKGMHTVVVMNTEDRQLDGGNWGEYRNKVLQACSAFAGKSDEFIVANEVTLHSPWSREEIRRNVESLIGECQQRFPGPVSYEAFWYEKDAWSGYRGRIYFNLYERVEQYRTNAYEMDLKFGSNAYVGEFGEDFSDEGTHRDEQWQKQQVEQRLSILHSTRTPVAYAFTYREPSDDGFGLLRPDGSHRPAWYALKGNAMPVAAPAAASVPALPAAQSPDIGSLRRLCMAGGTHCAVKSDIVRDSCRSIVFGTAQGDIRVLGCAKPDGTVELYGQQAPAGLPFKACLGSGCVTDADGSARFKAGTGSGVGSLAFTPAPRGKKTADSTDGSCRTVSYDTPAGGISAKVCEKDEGYEMYLLSGENGANLCVGRSCVGSVGGFAAFT